METCTLFSLTLHLASGLIQSLQEIQVGYSCSSHPGCFFGLAKIMEWFRLEKIIKIVKSNH